MPISLSFSSFRARLTLAGPKGNALTVEMIEAMRRAFAEISSRSEIRLLTVEAEGADFSFGSSIEEHLPQPITRVLPVFHALIRELVALPIPTAAVVRGRCLGGGFELALACDFIFASADAVMGVPEVALGLFPPVAAVLLPVRVGASRAASAILTGQSRPATDWAEEGLVEAVVPAADLDDEVAAFAARFFEPRSAVAAAHAARASRLALARALDALLPESERLYLESLMRSADAEEGVRAFLEKRPPRWFHR